VAQQFFGRATIKVDGRLIETLPGAKLDIGGVTRTPKRTDQSVGFTEQVKEATLECEAVMTKGLSLADFAEVTDATVTFKCDTGQTYIVRNAFLVDPPMVEGGDKSATPLKFAGPPAEEVL
jgi:hypothetical protein